MRVQTTDLRILAAVDGSTPSRAALSTLLEVPWPDGTRVRAVVAKQTRAPHRRSILLAALDRSADGAAEHARRTLALRYPDADAIVVDKAPVAGILDEARRFKADVIVVGWRGYGAARRLLMGSVSRGVVRGAKCAVLIARRASPPVRNIVLAFDGSANAAHAVSLVAKLSPPRGGRVTIVGVVELITPSSRAPGVAGIRSSIGREVRSLNDARARVALKSLDRTARELKRAGWRTRTVLKTGEPLRELLDTVVTSDAQLLVIGARGTSGVRHLLLGSVAEGALSRSPVPVLLTR